MMNLSITEAAVKRIKQIVNGEEIYYALRIGVVGGGCSGFSYQFDLVKEATENDSIFEDNGAIVVIDKMVLPLLDGSVLDYKDTITEQSFIINNPNATSSCGCGVSFSL